MTAENRARLFNPAAAKVPAADPFRLVDAADWFAEADADESAILWGTKTEAYWVAGESIMIVAPIGVGKTTLAGCLLEARLGLTKDLLGLPVKPAEGPILYLAMDRPQQIRRALRRRLGHVDPELLRGRLIIQNGPLLENIVSDPTLLLRVAQEAGATDVIVDSVKDLAIRLSDEETGGAYNRARQLLCADGRQLVELHHQKKASADGKPPMTLADVYGSTMIAAGTGSVVLMWAQPGDPIVEVRHLRSALGDVPMVRAVIDSTVGTIELADARVDPLVEVVRAGRLTADGLAIRITGTASPQRNDIEKARRTLRRLEREGFVQAEAETREAPGRKARTVFIPTLQGVMQVPFEGGQSNHAGNHASLFEDLNHEGNHANHAEVLK